MDDDALLRRLISAEALQSRATTEGERTAAMRACCRLRERLDRQTTQRRATVLAAFSEYPSVAPEIETRDLGPPRCEELRKLVKYWARGHCERAAVVAWAVRYAHGTVLPVFSPTDRRSLTIEVLLQLAGEPLLQREHASRVLEVLECQDALEGWAVWFDLLEAAASQRCVRS